MEVWCFGYLINSSYRIPNLQSAFYHPAVSLLINFACNLSQLLKINAFETANVLITSYDPLPILNLSQICKHLVSKKWRKVSRKFLKHINQKEEKKSRVIKKQFLSKGILEVEWRKN